MYLSRERKKSDLISVPSDPVQECKVISLISLIDFPLIWQQKTKETFKKNINMTSRGQVLPENSVHWAIAV